MATRETFAVNTQDTQEQLCFNCMKYFQDVFQLTNSNQIVDHIKTRSIFIQDFIDSFSTFITTDVDKCDKAGKSITNTELVTCWNGALNNILKKCQEKNTYAECLIARTLGERILKEASMCGTSACSAEDFLKKFKASVENMKNEFYQCRMAFQKTDDYCTQMYARILETKLGAPAQGGNGGGNGNGNGNGLALGQENKDTMSRAEIDEKLGDLATFAMIMT